MYAKSSGSFSGIRLPWKVRNPMFVKPSGPLRLRLPSPSFWSRVKVVVRMTEECAAHLPSMADHYLRRLDGP